MNPVMRDSSLAKESLLELLPGGRETPGHAIMTITDATTKDKVGVLWVQWENIERKSVRKDRN